MKKLVFATVVGLAPALIATSAYADGGGMGGTYVGISGVAAMVGDVDGDNGRTGADKVKTTAEMDTSLGVLVRAGKQFDGFRAELELGYRNIEVDSIKTANGKYSSSSGDADAYSVMVNGVYDFDSGSAVTPYVMVGVGALSVDGDVKYTDDNGRAQTASADGTTIAGQIGLGISYELSSNVDLVAGYSFLGAPTDETGDDQILQVHNAQIGINYAF